MKLKRKALLRALVCMLSFCSIAQQAGEILPADPGLDGGNGGHWGTKNDKHWVDSRWNNAQVGSLVSCSLMLPGGGRAAKGMALVIGDRQGGVCFNAEKLGIVAGWTGKFVRFNPRRFGLIDAPIADGNTVFSIPHEDLWNGSSGRYSGLHMHGERTILAYTVNNCRILESPWLETIDGAQVITRTLQVGAGPELCYTIAAGTEARISAIDGLTAGLARKEDHLSAVAVLGDGATLKILRDNRITLALPSRSAPKTLKLLQWTGTEAELSRFASAAKKSMPPEDLGKLAQPGPARWGDALVTKGSVSTDTRNAYVIDSIAVPFKNPNSALLFCSGIDFLPNGDAVISTLHGDVWQVGGIDDKLENVKWKRFATGLYQPIGVRVVKGQVYVHGRDQITRLHDMNNDGEADYYENFCNLMRTSTGGHDYSAGLEIDAAGNFVYVDPFGVHRLSPDGQKHSTIATGWRNPIAVNIAYDETIFVAPQEGDWTPASQICEVKPGGYYGFGGPIIAPERPLGYEPPLCYVPRLVDNSTGGFANAPEKNWGPLTGQMLNLSFGQCTLQLVLRERIGTQAQGGVVPLPMKFQSGIIRGRVRPQDNQLYLVGTQGWVSGAVRDGCLQRLRYTGAKLCLPASVKVYKDGILLSFSESLEKPTAEDVENYSIEQWNYRYSKEYGSKEYSVVEANTVGHDAIDIISAQLNGNDVFLAIKNLTPAMQVRIRYRIKAENGEPVRGEVVYTINQVRPSRQHR